MPTEYTIVFDRRLMTAYGSHSLERATGFARGYLAGKTLAELFDDASCALIDAWWNQKPLAQRFTVLSFRNDLPVHIYLRRGWLITPLHSDSAADLAVLSYSEMLGEESDETDADFSRQLESFSAVVSQSIAEENSTFLYTNFVEAITEISEFTFAAIVLGAGELGEAHPVATSGVADPLPPDFALHPPSLAQVREILREKEYRVGGSCYLVPVDKLLSNPAHYHGGEPVLIIPFFLNEQVLGYLFAAGSRSGMPATARSIKPLELFAVQMAQVLVRNRLEDDLHRSRRELQHLFDMSVLLNSSIDAEEVLGRLAQAILEQFDASHVSVFILDDEVLRRQAWAGAEPGAERSGFGVNEGVVGRAVYQGRYLLEPDVAAAPYYVPDVPETRSQLVVPISTKAVVGGTETESVIGAISVEADVVDTFSDEDARLLQSIANTAAMAIENSRLMQHVLILLKKEAAYGQELARRKKELDEFVHSISHDLKNPLNNVAGFAELLQNEVRALGSEKANRYIERIRVNVDNVSRMITDLLELSRVGRMDSEFGPVPIDALVREIRYDFKNSHTDMDVEINCFNLPETAWGNPHRIAQLFGNLITNAVKYRHPDRPPRITISCIDEGEFSRFSVGDNGLGIDEQHLASVFVFGVRLKENAAEGTGAGLAIAQKIVESHGGRIWVESEKGQGSTFFFTLPKNPPLIH